jgi:predicted HTH transcriptional regulator
MKHQSGNRPERKVVNAMKKNTTKKATRKPATTVKRNVRKQAASSPTTEQTTQTVKQSGKASKKQTIINLLQQDGGTTLAELAAATGWQAHSLRGFISGTLRKNLAFAVGTAKNDAGKTVYRITT